MLFPPKRETHKNRGRVFPAMPFKSVAQAISTFASKPHAILIAILFSIINLAVFGLVLDSFAAVLGNTVSTEISAGIFETPFYWAALQGPDLWMVGIAAIIGVLLQVIASFAFARIAIGDGVGESIQWSFRHWKAALAAGLFGAIIVGILFWIALIVLTIGAWNGLLGAVLGLLVFFIAFYCALRFSLYATAMAVDESGVQDGLWKSWKATSKFLPIFAFAILLLIVQGILGGIGNIASGFVADEWAQLAIGMLFVSVSSTIAGIALGKYYLARRVSASRSRRK